MSQQQNDLVASKERILQNAIIAIKRNPTLTQRRAAKLYNVPQSSISNRCAGKMYRRDRAPNSRRLLDTEEEVFVKHVLDLDARGFPAQLAAVEDMANSLRDARHLQPVGINWAATFVKCRPELRFKFNRKYDYKRALCKDPEIIEGWFRLIVNMKAKYGIQDEDTYNFDETGFMMGQISTGAVVTGSER